LASPTPPPTSTPPAPRPSRATIRCSPSSIT
jgi:hypothetical protein